MKNILRWFALPLLLCLFPVSLWASSFFMVEWIHGKAWFKTPEGKPFLSMGVNAIGDQSLRAPNDHYYNPVKNQYQGNKKNWIKNTLDRLKKWHFNTIGCWSDEDLPGQKFPFTQMLYIARGNPWESVLNSVFSDNFEKLVRENAQKAVTFKNDPQLIGYFLDNELPWWGDYGWKADGQKSLLERYAAVNLDDPNKEALEAFFKERYANDIDQFNNQWNTNLKSFDEMEAALSLIPRTKNQKADANAWAGVVAERYFSVTTKVLREVDPNHLILGVRFAGEAPWEVVEACGTYCDVISVNSYSKSGNVDQALLDDFYAKTKKPILITEYSFSATENQSGDPNTKGADVSVPTQKERVEHLDVYAHQALNLPYLVGLHWFEWADESPEGRFDGENSDYGLVDIQDKEYAALTQKHTALNLLAEALHQNATHPLPAEFKPPQEAAYRKAEEGALVPSSRSYLKIDSSAVLKTWGDASHEGKTDVEAASGVINVNFSSGTGWGCGFSASSNLPPFAAAGVVDLRGYNLFRFKAFVPLGLNFYIFLTESGNPDPSSTDPTGVNGADGESYSFPGFTGTGKWQTYEVDLDDLERRTAWGNQHGNNILDLQGLAAVDFSIAGGQGSGKMLVKDLEFRVK